LQLAPSAAHARATERLERATRAKRLIHASAAATAPLSHSSQVPPSEASYVKRQCQKRMSKDKTFDPLKDFLRSFGVRADRAVRAKVTADHAVAVERSKPMPRRQRKRWKSPTVENVSKR
jgi:hypothetical protein